MTFHYLLRKLGLALLLCLFAPPIVAAAPLKMFVSIEPLRYLAEQVGNEHVEVGVMIAPGESPATFSPTPRTMAQVRDARLFVSVGVPSERSWLPKLKKTFPDIQFIDARDGLTLRRMEEHVDSAKGEHNHGEQALDPHVWTDPLSAIHIAARIRDALIELDPANRKDYERNFATLEKRLRALDQQIAIMLEPLKSRSFIVFHPSWGYLAERYGLKQIAIEYNGKSPRIRQLGKLVQVAQDSGNKIIIVQPQFSRRDADAIATEIGARVVVVDPLAYNIPSTLLKMAQTLASTAPSK